MSGLLAGVRDRLYWKSQPDRLPATAARNARLGVTTMTILRRRRALLPVLAALALTAAPAAAQQDVPDTGGLVYGLVGGGFGDGTFSATGAGAGLRLTPHVGLDVELTHLSGRRGREMHTPWLAAVSTFSAAAASAVAEDYPPIGVDIDDYPFPPIRFEDQGRDVTTFLTKFTVEFPIADGRLFPYLTGGGGVGRVTERFGIIFDPIPWIPWEDLSTGHAGGFADADGAVHFSDSLTIPSPTAYSELGLALVLGGGVDVRLWRGLGAGVDIRWLRVLRDYGALDTAQVTARASYRF